MYEVISDLIIYFSIESFELNTNSIYGGFRQVATFSLVLSPYYPDRSLFLVACPDSQLSCKIVVLCPAGM